MAYVTAKRQAEEIAIDEGNAIVVNPGYLTGPEDSEKSVMGRICTRFWKGRLFLAPPGGLSVVDVRDVATGHLLAAERGLPCRRYILAGDNLTYGEIYRSLAEVANCQPRALPRLPQSGLVLLACAAEVRAKVRGREPYPSFAHARMSRYYWYASSARAERELGYKPRSAFESFTDAYRWHAAHEELKTRGLNRWWMRPAA